MTDRCNIRCVYCMPEEVQFQPRSALLTFEEIERVTRVAVTLGFDKVRLTGGEPLVRRDLPTLVEKLVAIPGLHGRRADDQRHPAGTDGPDTARRGSRDGSISASTRWTRRGSSG